MKKTTIYSIVFVSMIVSLFTHGISSVHAQSWDDYDPYYNGGTTYTEPTCYSNCGGNNTYYTEPNWNNNTPYYNGGTTYTEPTCYGCTTNSNTYNTEPTYYTTPTYSGNTQYTEPTYYGNTNYSQPTYYGGYNYSQPTYYGGGNNYIPSPIIYNPTIITPGTRSCSQEARLCDGGTTVYRSGPNCDFTSCPLPRVCGVNQTLVNGVCVNQTRTCADGTIVNVSDTCYKTCPNGSRVPESQSCATYCSDGTQAINNVCYRTCTDGSRVPESQSCPTPNRVCPDGSVVPSNQSCPTRVCANGTAISINQTCYRTCSNGTTVPETSLCYRTCPNGTTVPETNLCPTQNQTCWDGSIIPVTSVCPNQYKICPNGTSVPITQSCNRTCPNGNIVLDGQTCYRTCPNGATVPDNQSCPMVTGYPWLNLTIDRTAVPFGGTATLSWTSQNTSSCVASNGWTGARPLQGTEPRYNITTGVTYTLTCYNANGVSVSDSVFVTTGNQSVRVNNVITSIPTEITSTSARCNGIGLISNNANSNAWFEYGETRNLGRTTATANIGSAITSPFSNVLAGLKPNTTYYCRAVMANSNGTIKGDIVAFTTKSKKTVYVKPTIKTTTTKTVTKVKATKEIICSDGSTLIVKNQATANILSTGGKLIEMQLEKKEGDLSVGSEATYRLSYKNTSESTLKNATFKITIPAEFTVFTATGGAYDKETRTLTIPMVSLMGNAQGDVSWTVQVSKDAQIGKTVVTPAVVTYTIPDVDGNSDVQDEVSAYVMGTITPGNAQVSTTLEAVKKTNFSFLPNSLIEWLALFAIILILMILGRSIYISWKGEPSTTH